MRFSFVHGSVAYLKLNSSSASDLMNAFSRIKELELLGSVAWQVTFLSVAQAANRSLTEEA
jgi:hypothetical protein